MERVVVLRAKFESMSVVVEPWLSFKSSGGIAGLVVNLTISSEGRVQYQERGTVREETLSASEMEELKQSVPSPFPSFQQQRPRVSDGFRFELQVGQDKAEWGTLSPLPEELNPLLELLEKIRSRFSD